MSRFLDGLSAFLPPKDVEPDPDPDPAPELSSVEAQSLPTLRVDSLAPLPLPNVEALP